MNTHHKKFHSVTQKLLVPIAAMLCLCAQAAGTENPQENLQEENLNAASSAAESGGTEAMVELGKCYRAGYGVEKDYAAAVECFQKAADAGNTEAMINLGFHYYKGVGVEKDASKAVEWYQKAADAGNTEAMIGLGVCYEEGTGIKKDARKAAEWFRKAADAGDTYALVNLGLHCCYVAKDAAEGVRWLQKAADAGDGGAMLELGFLYREGQCVEANEAESAQWFRKAAAAGCRHAEYMLVDDENLSDDDYVDKMTAIIEHTLDKRRLLRAADDSHEDEE